MKKEKLLKFGRYILKPRRGNDVGTMAVKFGAFELYCYIYEGPLSACELVYRGITIYESPWRRDPQKAVDCVYKWSQDMSCEIADFLE